MATKSKDQQDLTKALYRLVDVITKQQTTIGSFATSSRSKSEGSTSGKARVSAISEKNEALEEEKKLAEDINELRQESLKQEKLIGTEKYKQVDISKAYMDTQQKDLNLTGQILDAQKEGNFLLADELRSKRKVIRDQRIQLGLIKKLGAEQDIANKKIVKYTEDVNKKIKFLKNPIDSIGDALKEKVSKRMQEAAIESAKTGKSFNAWGGVIKTIAGAAGIGLLVGGLKMAFERGMHLNQELTDMQRGLGVSYKEANKLHHALQDANLNQKVLGANQKDYNDAFNALNSTMGINVAHRKDMLDAQVLLTKQMGMSNDEAKEFQMMSIGTGKSSEENLLQIKEQVETYNGLTGDSLSVREIQQDIAKSSKSTLANYKGDVTALGRAVIQAKKLGLTMAETEQISNSLLDFESSIEAEMKASVMTGQHINMNKARELALMGDTAGAAAEALKQAGSFDKFQKMDVLQKKAVAEAAGMTVEQIMKAGQLEKMNSKFGVKSMKALTKEQQAQLVKEKVMTQEQIDQEIKKEQSISAQEKMNTMIDKMYTLFDKVASGPIEMILNGITKMGEGLTVAKNFLKGMLPDWLKTFLKSDLAGTVGKVAGAVGIIAAGIKVFNSFRKKKPEEEQVDLLKSIDSKIGGSGVGGNGAAPGAEESDDVGSKVKKGLKGSKRLFKAFKKGGLKGGMKAAGRMIKGGFKGALGMGSGGAGKSPMDAITNSGQKGASKLTSSAGATASTGSKVASKGGGFFSKIGGFFSKLNPLKAIKGAFTGPGLKKILSKIPKIGSIISAAMAIHGVAGAGASGAGAQDVGKQLVMAIGDMGGTFLGGLLGSIIPGAGTLIGGFLGGMGGSALAGLIADNVDVSGIGKAAIGMFGSKTPEAGAEAASPKEIPVKDALIRPGQPPITFDKGDLIMAGTNLEGGGKGNAGGGSSEIASLLKQLIAKVDQPVHVNIGGRVMDEIEKQTSLKKTYTTKTDKGYSAFG
jgi:hypothetical protein